MRAVTPAQEASAADVSVWAVGFDRLVVAAGAVIAASAVVVVARDLGHVRLDCLLAIPLIMVMGWFPMLIGRTGAGIEIGLDVCVLIFLADVVSPAEALVIWTAGTALSQAMMSKRVATRLFNSGLGVLAGGAALLTIDALSAASPDTPQDLLAMTLGAAVYFVVDFTVSAVSLSLEAGSGLQSDVLVRETLAALVAFVAIASLGYLAVLVEGGLPGWSIGLLAVPVATILIASRALSRGEENARRLTAMVDAAVLMQTVSDRAALVEAVRVSAGTLLHEPRVVVRASGPTSDEIGVRIDRQGDELWIVGPARKRARSDAAQDYEGLKALAAVAEDAFDRLQLTDAMAHLAWHDPLTGLSNRSVFMDRVKHAMDLQGRRGGLLAVLFYDLDGFKRVNDLFGHAVGDELLIEVGRRIKCSVRATDTVSRLGGDEFAILLEDVSDATEVNSACQRILEALRPRMHFSGEDVSVTITIGVAMSETGGSADALLSQADLAMYHAKSKGKNRFETYRAAFGDERRQRIELVESLHHAIEDRHLGVVYQPVLDLLNGRIVGVEALVRWRQADGTVISPDLFIPTAEESGLIVQLGEVVLDLVLADVPALAAAAGEPISIGVNVAAQQLLADGFVDLIEAAAGAVGECNLILEVTERDFVHDDPQTLAVMHELASTGILFAIDDFGVGYSSIGYLQRLPVHILKLDRSFLEHIEDDPKACSLAGSVVAMGTALGLDVVIEGIERQGQLDVLVGEAGARLGQGYLLAMPMAARDVAALLSAQPSSASADSVAGVLPDAATIPASGFAGAS